MPAGSSASSPRALPPGSRSPRAWRGFKSQRLREISWPKEIRVRGGDYGAGLCLEIMTRRVHPHTDRNADLNRSPRSSFPWLSVALGSHTGALKHAGSLSTHDTSEMKEGEGDGFTGHFWGAGWVGRGGQGSGQQGQRQLPADPITAARDGDRG